MNASIRRYFSSTLAIATLVGGLALGLADARGQEAAATADFASEKDPPLFDAPAEAVEALKAALAADDFDGTATLLGLDAAKLRTSEGVMDSYAKIRERVAKQVFVRDLGDRQELDIGTDLWPLPFPITKGEDGKWAFDTYAGITEIVKRRVGENELEAIATARAYVDAQRDYAADDRDGDGVLEYAQKLISSEEKTDGLYWPLEQGDGASPVGEFIDQAALDKAAGGAGYFGYRFRILTGQGDKIAGGSYDYVINGNMIAGFALLAWPVTYGVTGVQTFVVNHHGIVYEADLGPSTEAIVKYIDRFNPDETWEVSEP
jgi:hypothetical protein